MGFEGDEVSLGNTPKPDGDAGDPAPDTLMLPREKWERRSLSMSKSVIRTLSLGSG